MDQDISESREKSRIELLTAVGDASRRNQAATDVFDEVTALFLGVNRTDGRCLDIIDRHGRVSAGQLANESGLTTGAVTAVIDRLERAGYVQRIRDQLDRRKIWVECTPEMRAIIGQIYGFYDVLGPTMTRRFSDEQARAILAFLEISRLVQTEMAAGIREHMPPASSSTGDRVERAARFRRAMEAAAPRLVAMIDAIPVPEEPGQGA
jgi:DNA-binding MarR family transcriptional regulator